MGWNLYSSVQQEEFGGAVREMVCMGAGRFFNYSLAIGLDEQISFNGIVGTVYEIVHVAVPEVNNPASLAKIEFGRPLSKDEIETLVNCGFEDV